MFAKVFIVYRHLADNTQDYVKSFLFEQEAKDYVRILNQLSARNDFFYVDQLA